MEHLQACGFIIHRTSHCGDLEKKIFIIEKIINSIGVLATYELVMLSCCALYNGIHACETAIILTWSMHLVNGYKQFQIHESIRSNNPICTCVISIYHMQGNFYH